MISSSIDHGTIEPTLDKIEVEYQCRLALSYTAGLQLLPFMIGVNSPIITNALSVSCVLFMGDLAWLVALTKECCGYMQFCQVYKPF